MAARNAGAENYHFAGFWDRYQQDFYILPRIMKAMTRPYITTTSIPHQTGPDFEVDFKNKRL